MTDLAIYGLLFASAFLSATLLPGSSEVALLALLANGEGSPTLLLVTATFGNVLGAVVNFLLGKYVSRFLDHRWCPISPDSYEKARIWYDRYGVWSLLLSWVPVVGDPLTVLAGALQVGFWRFVVLVTTGKAARYGLVYLLWQGWSQS